MISTGTSAGTRTDLSYIHRLPDELLLEIFHLLRTRDENRQPVSDRLRASHVCRYWRAIFLECAALWTDVVRRRVEETELMFERSKLAPKLVIFHEPRAYSTWHKHTLLLASCYKALEQFQDISRIDIGVSSRIFAHEVLPLLLLGSSSLHTMCLSSPPSQFQSDPYNTPLPALDAIIQSADRFPSLRLLTFRGGLGLGTGLPHFQGLSELELYVHPSNAPRMSWIQFDHITTACPELRSLSLWNMIPIAESTLKHVLPSTLQALVVGDVLEAFPSFFPSVLRPAGARLHARLQRTGDIHAPDPLVSTIISITRPGIDFYRCSLHIEPSGVEINFWEEQSVLPSVSHYDKLGPVEMWRVLWQPPPRYAVSLLSSPFSVADLLQCCTFLEGIQSLTMLVEPLASAEQLWREIVVRMPRLREVAISCAIWTVLGGRVSAAAAGGSTVSHVRAALDAVPSVLELLKVQHAWFTEEECQELYACVRKRTARAPFARLEFEGCRGLGDGIGDLEGTMVSIL